jgi:integrase
MALYRRGRIWWYEFYFQNERIRDTSKSTSKTVARAAEADHRRRLEKTLAGMPMEDKAGRVRTVAAAVTTYLEDYRLGHRPKSVLFAEGRLKHVVRLLGTVLLHELTEAGVRDYQRTRLDEGVSGRTIDMELGELSRAIGQEWGRCWPKVKKLADSREVGRCLSDEEISRLLEACDKRAGSIGLAVRIALATGMRAGEISSLRWDQVDLVEGHLTVGKAKTAGGSGRRLPLNPNLKAVLEHHASWYGERFGPIQPTWYLFPWGAPSPSDPTRHLTDATTAWDTVRREAGVSCRFHDLRHTVCTKMAQAGIPEAAMLNVMGHLSRAMLMRYSHINMAAKRAAVAVLALPEGFQTPKLPPTKSPTMKGSERPN